VELGLNATVVGLLAALGIFILALWRQRRDQPGNPSLVPWTALQYGAGLVAVLLAAHLVSLVSGVRLHGMLG